MADSLRTQFTTKNGRIVYDGRGVMPDFIASDSNLNNISIALLRKNIIFDFVTLFRSKNDSIASAKSFEVNDALFNDFKAFIVGKDYSYETKTEKILAKLEKNTKVESYYTALEEELRSLHDKLNLDKANDVDKFQAEIKQLIKSEILTRYYFQKGKIIAGLSNDNYLEEAIRLIKDEDAYNALFKVDTIGVY